MKRNEHAIALENGNRSEIEEGSGKSSTGKRRNELIQI